MTAEMMRRFGAKVEQMPQPLAATDPVSHLETKKAQTSAKEESCVSYRIPAFCAYRSGRYEIEPDVSAACYFYAMAAISGGSALVSGVHRDSL